MSMPILFSSADSGAPTLNNVVGSMNEVLKACLVNGYNAHAVTSIDVAGEVATATCAAHGFSGTFGKLVLIEGASDPLLNGVKQPGGVLTNSFTFPAVGVADGTYTGSMSAKRAPLGWTEQSDGAGRSIFKSANVAASAYSLRVDDSGVAPATADVAIVLIVSDVVDASTYTRVAPTVAQSANGNYWQKGTNNATAKSWMLLGDDLGFYFICPLDTVGALGVPYWFGDGIPFNGTDVGFCFLSGQTNVSYTPSPAAPLGSGGGFTAGSNNFALMSALDYSGTFEARYLTKSGGSGSNGSGYAGFPDSSVGGFDLILGPIVVMDNSPFVMRGIWPGQWAFCTKASKTHGAVFQHVDGGWFLAISANISGVQYQIPLSLQDWRQ